MRENEKWTIKSLNQDIIEKEAVITNLTEELDKFSRNNNENSEKINQL
jgi:hypothetical protein